MGGIFSRHNTQKGKKLFNFRICPGEVHEVHPKKPPRSQTIHHVVNPSEWTNVTLQVPDSTDSSNTNVYDRLDKTPIPPPRKNKARRQNTNSMVESTIHKTKTAGSHEQYSNNNNSVPVEEPIIVPQKVPIHICDGTHHHAANFVHEIPAKPTINTHIVEETVERIYSKPRPKHSSTVSLPNYQELSTKNKIKYGNDLKSIDSSKKPKRHISVMSLPSESKVELSETTTARLENYITRCRSFGSLPPQELIEKLKNQDYSSDSEDSWDGMDDWEIQTKDGNVKHAPPLEPRSRITAPLSNITHEPDLRLPTTIEEVEETPRRPSSSLASVIKNDGRRDSIDDFFDAKALNPFHSNEDDDEPPVNYLGRRGSDSFFDCNSSKHYSDKGPILNSDAFFTNSMLQSESTLMAPNNINLRRKSAGPTLHRIDSQDSEGDNESSYEKVTKRDVPKANSSNNHSTDDTFQAKDNGADGVKDKIPVPVVPRRKSGVVEHSSLLKFLQENSVENNKTPENKENDYSSQDVIEEFEVPEPLRSAIKDVENKIKNIDSQKGSKQ